jgi:hypothetical protein
MKTPTFLNGDWLIEVGEAVGPALECACGVAVQYCEISG